MSHQPVAAYLDVHLLGGSKDMAVGTGIQDSSPWNSGQSKIQISKERGQYLSMWGQGKETTTQLAEQGRGMA